MRLRCCCRCCGGWGHRRRRPGPAPAGPPAAAPAQAPAGQPDATAFVQAIHTGIRHLFKRYTFYNSVVVVTTSCGTNLICLDWRKNHVRSAEARVCRIGGARGRFVGGGASGTRSGCVDVSVGPGTEDGACGGRAPARPGRSCGSAFSSPAARGACLAAFFRARSSRRVAVASLCEKRGNSVTRATGDETNAGPSEGGEGAQHLSLGPRIRACPVVQSQRAEYAQTKPRGFQAGCTLGEVQKLWAVGQAAGEWLPGLLQPIPHHVRCALVGLYKPHDGNRNGRAFVWQTSDRLCHVAKGNNADDRVRLGMADSSSDVLRKEFCLFIHRNALRTQQIGFNVTSKRPGPKTINCFAFWSRCALSVSLPVVFGG